MGGMSETTTVLGEATTATWNDAPLAALARFASDIANLMAECRLHRERQAGSLLAVLPK
jgi:hypothetical protein